LGCYIKELVGCCLDKSKALKTLQKQFDLMTEESKLLEHQNKSLPIQNENLKMRNEILEKNQLSNIKKIDRPLTKFDNVLEEFIIGGIDRTNLISMIYGVSRNKREEIGFTIESPFKKV